MICKNSIKYTSYETQHENVLTAVKDLDNGLNKNVTNKFHTHIIFCF